MKLIDLQVFTTRILSPLGLRLSYDDDEHNSSVTSSGSMTAAPSIILSLGDSIRAELDRQKEELDQYIKIQVLASFKHIKVAVIYIIYGIHIGILVPNQFLPNLIIISCFLLGQISKLYIANKQLSNKRRMYLLIKKLIFIIIFSNENSQILFQLHFWPSQVVLIGFMQDEQLVKGVRDMKRRHMGFLHSSYGEKYQKEVM